MNGPFNLLGAYTQACGVELEVTGGVSVTVLVYDYAPTDTSIKVQSTLGFPPSGYLDIDGFTVYYGSKTSWKFQDLVTDHFVTVPSNTRITSAVRKAKPDSYELFWLYPWAGNDYGVSV